MYINKFRWGKKKSAKRLFEEIINIIPTIEIRITIGNSVLFNDLSFEQKIYRKTISPEPNKIIHFKKEPNESKTKKPLKISSKWKISFKRKNCAAKSDKRVK